MKTRWDKKGRENKLEKIWRGIKEEVKGRGEAEVGIKKGEYV
jgi:hypothetical protein